MITNLTRIKFLTSQQNKDEIFNKFFFRYTSPILYVIIKNHRKLTESTLYSVDTSVQIMPDLIIPKAEDFPSFSLHGVIPHIVI